MAFQLLDLFNKSNNEEPAINRLWFSFVYGWCYQ